MNSKLGTVKLWLVKLTPWWVLRALWKAHIVDRSTVFRWEMNAMIWEWDPDWERN